MKVTDYYYLVEKYERRFNVDCLSLEYFLAFQKAKTMNNPIAFIQTVLKNAALDQIRKRNRSVTFTDCEVHEASIAEDTSLDFYDAVHQCTNCFDQDVLALRLMGWSSYEIADTLECDYQKVTASVRRLREHFRSIYEWDT